MRYAQAFKIGIFLALLFTAPWWMQAGVIGNWGDITQYVLPLRAYAAREIMAGHFPTWNPYIFAGAPFLASPQSALFYPGTLLFFFFTPEISVKLFGLLHLLLLFFGIYLLAAEMKFSRSAALAASIVGTFAHFMLAKFAAGHILHLSGYSLFPYILLFTKRIFDSTARWPAIGLAAALTVQFFSGHLQVCVVTILILAFYFLHRVLWIKNKITITKKFIHAAICFLFLFSAQGIPTLHYFLNSTRHQVSLPHFDAMSKTFAMTYSAPISSTQHLMHPFYQEKPNRAESNPEESPSLFFETRPWYFGFLAFLLALGGAFILIRRKQYFWIVLAILGLFLAWGKNFFIYEWFWQLFSFQRVPARFFFLTYVAVLLLLLVFWQKHLVTKKPLIKFFLLLLMTADLFISSRFFFWSEPLRKATPLIKELQENLWINNKESPSAFKKMDYRVWTLNDIPGANRGMFFNLKNVNGFEAILPANVYNFFGTALGINALTTTGLDLPFIQPNILNLLSVKYVLSAHPLQTSWPVVQSFPPILIYVNPQPLYPVWSTKYWVNATGDITNNSLKKIEKTTLKQIWSESKVAPFAKEEEAQWQLQEAQFITPEKLKTRWHGSEQSGSYLFFSQAFYPGWKLFDDQDQTVPIVKAYNFFQAAKVKMPASKTITLYWIYDPLDIKIGLTLTMIAILLLTTLGFRYFFARISLLRL